MKNRIVLLFVFIQLSLFCTAQIKDFYKTTSNSAILLYKKTNGRLIAHGTGFLLCNNDNGSDETILVTCEHVTHHDTLIAAIPATDSLKAAFLKNRQQTLSYASNSGIQTIGFDGNNLLFDIPIKPGINAYAHSKLDLVAIFCDLPNTIVTNENNVIALSNLKTLPKSYISEKDEMYAGQEITFVGFPSGIGTQNGFYGTSLGRDQKTNPLFRKGIISWTSDNADIFLVDGFSYGGNSGSPIFSIPNAESAGKLIGMVFGHLNDEIQINNAGADSLDDKIKSTTSLHINNGLAKCIPAYIIYDFALTAVKNRSMLLSKNMKDYNCLVQ